MASKAEHPAVSFLRSRLQLRHLRLLLAIDEAHTVTAAAALLGVSQVAASKTLAEIEAGLEAQLFERRRGGLVPTETCLRMLNVARRITSEIQCLGEDFLMENAGFKGRVLIGLQTQSAQPFLTRAIVDFKNTYPLITLEFTIGASHELGADLARGHLHFVIGPSAIIDLHPGFASEAIPAEQAVVVAGAECPFGDALATWAELVDYPWVLPPSGRRGHLDQILAREGLQLPHNHIEMPPTFLAEAVVRESSFCALVPSSVGRQWAARGGIRIVNIEVPPTKDLMALVWSNQSAMTPAARMFLTFVRREIVSELGEDAPSPENGSDG